MRVAVALLASAFLVGAAPALAADNGRPADRLAACDALGDHPTNDQVRDCVKAAERFVQAHRAMIEKARVEIRAHQADIDAATRAWRDNAGAIREAEQQLRSGMDEMRDALRQLRENERTLGAPPDQAPAQPDAPQDAPAK